MTSLDHSWPLSSQSSHFFSYDFSILGNVLTILHSSCPFISIIIIIYEIMKVSCFIVVIRCCGFQHRLRFGVGSFDAEKNWIKNMELDKEGGDEKHGPDRNGYKYGYLVGGLEHEFYDFPYIYMGRIIIPTDELIFFRGVETTDQLWIWLWTVDLTWFNE